MTSSVKKKNVEKSQSRKKTLCVITKLFDVLTRRKIGFVRNTVKREIDLSDCERVQSYLERESSEV